MYLLDKVDSDDYMFCDQDDIWFPHGMRRLIIYDFNSREEKYTNTYS